MGAQVPPATSRRSVQGMDYLHIVRCGRSGDPYPPGKVFRDAGQVLTVVASNRVNTNGHPGMPGWPKDDCWRIVHVTALPADDEESITFLEEEARNAARREWYEQRVKERRAAYLASKSTRTSP
jgi:hypothetical protein